MSYFKIIEILKIGLLQISGLCLQIVFSIVFKWMRNGILSLSSIAGLLTLIFHFLRVHLRHTFKLCSYSALTYTFYLHSEKTLYCVCGDSAYDNFWWKSVFSIVDLLLIRSLLQIVECLISNPNFHRGKLRLNQVE